MEGIWKKTVPVFRYSKQSRRSKDHKSCETVTAIEIEVIRNNGLTDIIAPINGTLEGLFSEETIPDKIVDLFGQLERSKLLKTKVGLSSKHRQKLYSCCDIH